MIDLSYFPVFFCFALSVEGSILCIFHLFAKLIKDWQNVIESLWSFTCLKCSNLRHNLL